MERGLASSNYVDYESDDAAFQGERDFVEDLPAESKFEDFDFPADSRSCYFDPFNPPKGYIPGESLRWLRISDGAIEKCSSPATYVGNKQSQDVIQGALGNKYFINALRLVGGNPKLVKRCLISDTYASKGIFTCKFYKAGRWRYVHIDDRIPCRPCGSINFCRNKNPNEIFAMVIEKAYAKLHGCYEGICFGLVENMLLEFLYGGFVNTIKCEVASSLHLNYVGIRGEPNINDIIWDALEGAMDSGYTVGCMRVAADDVIEPLGTRSGISLDYMYQVVDICVVSAETTATMAELSIGMICVKNIQPKKARFKGRWGLGSEAWALYPEIASTLQDRSRDLQREIRNALQQKASDFYDQSYKSDDDEEEFKTRLTVTLEHIEEQNRTLYVQDELTQLKLKESDGFSSVYSGSMPALQAAQPMVEDLHWIQIEDFVEVFNRVYVLVDQSLTKKNVQVKSYSSKWIPDDFVAGSGGPPIFFPNSYGGQSEVEEDGGSDSAANTKVKSEALRFKINDKIGLSNNDFLTDDTADVATKLQIHHQRLAPEHVDDTTTSSPSVNPSPTISRDNADNADKTATATGTNGDTVLSSARRGGGGPNANTEDFNESDDEGGKDVTDEVNNANDTTPQEGEGVSLKLLVAEGLSKDVLGDNIDIHMKAVKDESLPEYDWNSNINDAPRMMNTNFTDNPMYPFTVAEVATITISLYQCDRKWSTERMTIDGGETVTYSKWVNRHTRLISCMKYPIAIGFVLVRLWGPKVRCTEFRLKKVVGQSIGLQFQSVAGNTFTLKPGRYAIIPYTHIPLEKEKEYVLQCQFIEGQLEFELDDVIKQRKVDSMASESDSDDEIDPFNPNNGDMEAEEEAAKKDVDFSDPVAKMEWEEKILITKAKRKVFEESIVFPPVPHPTYIWEYSENYEDKGFWGVLEEVGLLASQMRRFGDTINKVKANIKAEEDRIVAEKEEAKRREEELNRREKQRRKLKKERDA